MRRRCRASSRSIMHGSRRSASLRRVIVLRVPIRLSAVPARGSQEAGRRSGGVEFAPDSPLEGGVSCELVSEMPNSLLAGKIQGISPIRSLPAPRRPRKRARNQSLMGQFPTHPNREFFAALQGIKSGDQGSFRRDQGIRFRPLFGLPPDDKSDRSKSRKPDLELDAGFCPCERRARHAEIARRARRRERSAFRASRWRHRSRRAPPAAPSSTVAGGPRVRIHLPPADSPSLARIRFRASRTPAFRAGVRGWLGDRVGRDAQGVSISHQLAAISLSGRIPVPQ